MTGEVIAGEVVPAGGREVSTEPPDVLAPVVARWLVAVTGNPPSPHTLRAYQADIRGWFRWAGQHDVDPLAPSRTHVDLWARWLSTTPTKRTGRPPKPATVARAVASVASFYTFAVDEGSVEDMPVRRRARPKVPNVSTTVGLSRAEAQAFMSRLLVESPRDRAMGRMLLILGLRFAELASLNVGSVRPNAGQVTVRVVGKGNRARELVLAGPVVAGLGEYLTVRAHAAGLPGAEALDEDCPLFAAVGGGRLTQKAVDRVVKRVARAAGVPSWRSISPHGLRHSCATLMLDSGAPLHVVRDQLGHADTKTTERYDRARGALSRTGGAVHALAAFLDTPREAAAG